jgi:hypothetical protein
MVGSITSGLGSSKIRIGVAAGRDPRVEDPDVMVLVQGLP